MSLARVPATLGALVRVAGSVVHAGCRSTAEARCVCIALDAAHLTLGRSRDTRSRGHGPGQSGKKVYMLSTSMEKVPSVYLRSIHYKPPQRALRPKAAGQSYSVPGRYPPSLMSSLPPFSLNEGSVGGWSVHTPSLKILIGRGSHSWTASASRPFQV